MGEQEPKDGPKAVKAEKKEPGTQAKVYNLTIELLQVKSEKKETNRTFNDEIKRINGEIEDLLKEAGENTGK